MAQKPQIQYVGQFYIYGSEARELEEKAKQNKPKTRLPKIPKLPQLYIDPVAVGGLLVALVMLIVLAVGVVQTRSSWNEYTAMSARLNDLRKTNADLSHAYHTSYNAEEIREIAEGYGLIDAADAEYMYVYVTVPKHEPEPTVLDNVKWFVKGLFSGVEKFNPFE